MAVDADPPIVRTPDLARVAGRALVDPAFADWLLDEPVEAAADIGATLTDEQIKAITKLKVKKGDFRQQLSRVRPHLPQTRGPDIDPTSW
jgi:hypothetical protein